jgi:DNA modification methylase
MSVNILVGDVRQRLAELPDSSVHMVCTSPPYFNLRDYGCTGQIGLEDSPEAYIETMVSVFRDVRRVMRPDGVVFLNIGDSYATQPGKGGNVPQTKHPSNSYPRNAAHRSRSFEDIKPKDLLMIPALLALALRADGWYLRSEICWVKPNPMPESVRDRPTSAHEKIFLLSPSPRYFFDAEAVKEPSVDGELFHGNYTPPGGLEARNGRTPRPSVAKGGFGGKTAGTGKPAFRHVTATRNIRNVWTISTRGFKGAHFATFPPALVEPCIKAGTSERGCCRECGAPWERVVEKGAVIAKGGKGARYHEARMCLNRLTAARMEMTARESITTGWQPTCDCAAGDPVPAVVLDPFGGAGTTALVAARLGRDAILVELNPDYARMAAERIRSAGFPAALAPACRRAA